MTRILISGSRYWSNRRIIYNALGLAWVELGSDPDAVLVHGAARGADTLAETVWLDKGMQVEPHPADWHEYGKRAGVIRNAEMVALGADILLASPMKDSIGTRHCITIAGKAGILTRIYEG